MKGERGFMKFPILETDNLVLREINLRDSEAILRIFSDEEAMKHYDINSIKNIYQAEKIIEFFRKRYEEGKAIRWGICLKNTSEVIGTCGIQEIMKSASRASVGADLRRDYWEQGIMTEALRAIVKYSFLGLQINRLQCFVEEDNRASVKLVEKLGFEKEGKLRQYEYYKGKYNDLLIFSKLRRE